MGEEISSLPSQPRSRRTALGQLVVLAAAALVAMGSVQAAGLTPLAEVTKLGRMLLLRHAHAPGFGDPTQFALGDCATQRNLDAAGRDQARHLGQSLRAAGVTGARTYSSQWCRALETARLLDLGPVEPLPALN